MLTFCCTKDPYLNLDKTRGRTLLLLILILVLVEEVHFHAELVADLVNTSTLGADDTSNEFLSNFKLSRLYIMILGEQTIQGKVANTHITSDDLVVLSVLDDFLDLLDCAINIAADTSDLNDVLSRRIANLGTELDGQGLVLANDTVESVSPVWVLIQ